MHESSGMIINRQPGTRATYFFILSILALTGFEYFYRASALIIPVFVVSGLYFMSGKRIIKKQFLGVLLPITILSLFQTILGYNQSIYTTILLVLSFLTYCFIAVEFNTKLEKVFIDLTFYICVLSLIFFFLTYNTAFLEFITNKVAIYFNSLGSGVDVDLQNEAEKSKNILIYNFKNYAFTYNRNSGPFWEPGMFVVFVNIALFFNLLRTKRLLSTRNLIFIGTVITTFSTTGYIAALFAISVYLFFYLKSRFNIFFIFLLCIGAIYIAQLDFMQSKIVGQIENSNTNKESRFGAVAIHMKVIADYPITGVGDGAARFISRHTDAESTANGLTFVFVKYGLILGLAYYVFLFKSCINIMKSYSSNSVLGYCFFLLLLILAFSQDVTVRHFYFFLIVWGFVLGYNRYYPNAKFQLNNDNG